MNTRSNPRNTQNSCDNAEQFTSTPATVKQEKQDNRKTDTRIREERLATMYNTVTFTYPPHLCKIFLFLITPLQDIQELALWVPSRQRSSTAVAVERRGASKIENNFGCICDRNIRSVRGVVGWIFG